jgi:hypothetical protein
VNQKQSREFDPFAMPFVNLDVINDQLSSDKTVIQSLRIQEGGQVEQIRQ